MHLRLGLGLSCRHAHSEEAGTPPSASGTAPENQSFATGMGDQTFASSPWFSGPDLTYSLPSPPPGITINPATGVCTVSTLVLLALTSLVIRATNAFGHFEITILVEVTL